MQASFLSRSVVQSVFTVLVQWSSHLSSVVSTLFADAAASAGSHSEDEVAQWQRPHKVSPDEAGEEAGQEAGGAGNQEADESVAETEAALAGAQEAQQQAAQAQQEALADHRQTLMRLRQDMQQASGQPEQTIVRHTLPSQW